MLHVVHDWLCAIPQEHIAWLMLLYDNIVYRSAERKGTFGTRSTSLKHDLLALEQCTSQQLANRVSNVRTCNDCDWPLLPLAVPRIRQHVSWTHFVACTHQSNGIGTAPNQAPSTVPIKPPYTSSMGSRSATASLQVSPLTPCT